VTIDRLNIRLKGVSACTGQEVVKHLGSRLLKQLARQETALKKNPAARHDKVETGTITLQSGDNKDPSVLQERIVSGIVKTIAANAAHTRKQEQGSKEV
jgi:hypothetical protein